MRSLKEIEEDIKNLKPSQEMLELLDEFKLAFDNEITNKFEKFELNPNQIYEFIMDKITDFTKKFGDSPKVMIISHHYLYALKKHCLDEKILIHEPMETFNGIKLIESNNIIDCEVY